MTMVAVAVLGVAVDRLAVSIVPRPGSANVVARWPSVFSWPEEFGHPTMATGQEAVVVGLPMSGHGRVVEWPWPCQLAGAWSMAE